MTSWETLLDISFALICCWKPAKQLVLTFPWLPTDGISPGDFEVNLFNLAKEQGSIPYTLFWVELVNNTRIVRLVLLISFLLCPSPPSLQPSLLEKMAGRHKETCESISVAEHPMLYRKGWLSMICTTPSVLLVGKQRGLHWADPTSYKFLWIILGSVSIHWSPGHVVTPSPLKHCEKLVDTLQ